jgi:hypothetical protein
LRQEVVVMLILVVNIFEVRGSNCCFVDYGGIVRPSMLKLYFHNDMIVKIIQKYPFSV